ncbi:MAG: carbamoyl-phosphate synthase large subunit [Christensenellaceae bacterium]|nr:carbamoyl-phosphate synthase large subunit [Christensenellaceae bacterium]
MPLFEGLDKVMLIGSGPIVIGQAAEFDYAGTQALRALKALGLYVILVNPNPATIMTDRAAADEIYIEPLSLEVLRRIVRKTRPDGLLSTLGGQHALTLSMQLAREGFLEQEGVRLLGARLDTIDRAEDRQRFKDTMLEIGEPVIPSGVVTDIEAACALAAEIAYPVIVRPAFTLGGSGGGIAQDEAMLREIARSGLSASPIRQILVEKCIAGWKEIEFEVVRDGAGNAVCVCSMENLDPVGVHTGDSIVVAPAMTLANPEYQMLRTAALGIVHALGVEGGCNVQFALEPESFEYAVIEVNPRVSRSSALASKATGYPIAKVAAQIAVGLKLDEIANAVTGATTAFFEPAVDYAVVKFPRWPFDKFVYAKRALGTQMKATGEVMAIAPSFEAALMKAIRGAEIGMDTPRLNRLSALDDEAVLALCAAPTDERLFHLYEALARGRTVDELHALTMVDEWFLEKLKNILRMEARLMAEADASGDALSEDLYRSAKRMGFPDAAIRRLSGKSIARPLLPAYKMVDTCAAEFAAETPYFYAGYDEENEAARFIESRRGRGKRAIVLGSGPIRIGQGIEFDYASVHCVWTLKAQGYEVAMVNNNPETVSTDFDTADRLYFEPLTPEDVAGVIATERPDGVVVAFGGQTAIKLTRALADMGVTILGTQADAIDAAEDRERFDALLESLSIKRPRGASVRTPAQALEAAGRLGYPVLVRPSYVLGGQNMIIAFEDADIERYMALILEGGARSPILIDQYLPGVEVEVDAICDGEDVLIPGIMEHIERAGVHSGDSIAVYPAWNLTGPITERLIDCTKRLALGLNTLGLINIQYVIYRGEVYVIEANPRASRTIPYISKVTGLPVVELATRAMLGERLHDFGYGTGLYRAAPFSAVKVPVFSFEKLEGADSQLGPEMKSTGEVLGVGRTMQEAVYTGLLAAGEHMARGGGVLLSVRARDRRQAVRLSRVLTRLGYALYGTPGTAEAIRAAGMPCATVARMLEGHDMRRLLEQGKLSYVISNSDHGALPTRGSVQLRRVAIERGVTCLTSLDTAAALFDAIRSGYSAENIELVDIARLLEARRRLRFVKMRASGNDYIYFDCFDQQIPSPEALAVALSSRRHSIGGDGVVLIERSAAAEARVRQFNRDGTPGAVSGNALRCAAKYLYDSGRVRVTRFVIETERRSHEVRLYLQGGRAYSASVWMGRPDFTAAAVPVKLGDMPEMIEHPYPVAGEVLPISCVSMGNPHAVTFVDDVDAVDVEKLGPALERAPIFPERANASFVRVVDEATLDMRVWERGIGETLACGTAACAAVAVAVRLGYCPMGRDIEVRLPGGSMTIHQAPGGITLTGDAQKDFEGVIEV